NLNADGFSKITLRALPFYQGVTISPGAHGCIVNVENISGRLEGLEQTDIFLAHYQARSRYHYAMKAILARFRVYATTSSATLQGWHLDSTIEAIKNDPEAFFCDSTSPYNADAAPESIETIFDPLEYRGEPLRYTQNIDYKWRAIRIMARMVEKMALSHGRLVEEKTNVREQLYRESAV
ncbi:MAG: hypothetical protein HQL37_07580, partial [Alphaproteobacteria bacterium]|nr:hypothetical protein [Alphaproteobacteria bacterium]